MHQETPRAPRRTNAAALSFHVVPLLLAAFCAAAVAQSGDGPSEALRRHSLELVNQAREAEGLAPLQPAPVLRRAAQAHAEDMLRRGYFAHESPDGGTPLQRFRKAGGERMRRLAENIAQCQGCDVPADRAAVKRLQEGWMDSPHHRRNILMEGLTHYGFGLAERPDGTRYAVQLFAGLAAPAGKRRP